MTWQPGAGFHVFILQMFIILMQPKVSASGSHDGLRRTRGMQADACPVSYVGFSKQERGT